MEYNTSRSKLSIKEYGRGVQKLIDHLLTIKDDKERQTAAEQVVEIMGILNPMSKNIEDAQHKLWDHMIMMSDYQLQVESPYPIPTQENKTRRPDPLPYPKSKLKWSHFGKIFEGLYNKAMKDSDTGKKQGYTQTLGLFMKVAYNNWHNENVHEDMVKEELQQMSKGELNYEPGNFKMHVDSSNTTMISAKSHKNQNSLMMSSGKKPKRNNKSKNYGRRFNR